MVCLVVFWFALFVGRVGSFLDTAERCGFGQYGLRRSFVGLATVSCLG